MKSLKLIQLGDVHYPEHRELRIGDIKDTGAPSALVSAVAPKKLAAVMRKAEEVIKKHGAHGLLICGDLTTLGNLDEYSACVNYLQQVLDVANPSRWQPGSVHVVPGNHDVNRSKCDPTGADLYGKFDPLVKTWADVGLNVLTARDVRTSEIRPNGHSVRVISLNSCIGCGERRHLPSKLRDEIIAGMSKFAPTSKDALDLVYEQLDTPAFADDHIDRLIAAVEEAPVNSFPVVLAHHNVLPQSTPRIEIYTELINSGRFRSRLAACRRPLVYCHGHIHDDPIEQLVDYRHPGSLLVFVSAPLITEGFNLNEIVYSRNDHPIGCSITRFRASNSFGTIDTSHIVRIPLVDASSISRFESDRLRALLTVCSQASRDYVRFKEMRDQLNVKLCEQLQFDTVQDLVVEAEWLRLVEVRDREQECKNWKIRRIEP